MAKSRQEKMRAAALAAVNLYIEEESSPKGSLPANAVVNPAPDGTNTSRQNQWKHFGRQQIFHSRSHWQHGR